MLTMGCMVSDGFAKFSSLDRFDGIARGWQ